MLSPVFSAYSRFNAQTEYSKWSFQAYESRVLDSLITFSPLSSHLVLHAELNSGTLSVADHISSVVVHK